MRARVRERESKWIQCIKKKLEKLEIVVIILFHSIKLNLKKYGQCEGKRDRPKNALEKKFALGVFCSIKHKARRILPIQIKSLAIKCSQCASGIAELEL